MGDDGHTNRRFSKTAAKPQTINMFLDRVNTFRNDNHHKKPLLGKVLSVDDSPNKTTTTTQPIAVAEDAELPIHPSHWPQGPLLIRPTPQSSTKICGIRFTSGENVDGFTHQALPINSGREVRIYGGFPAKSLSKSC